MTASFLFQTQFFIETINKMELRKIELGSREEERIQAIGAAILSI